MHFSVMASAHSWLNDQPKTVSIIEQPVPVILPNLHPAEHVTGHFKVTNNLTNAS